MSVLLQMAKVVILFFGVADDDTLVGLEDARRVSEKISEIIKTRMDPIPQTDLELHEENGKQFIILRILPGVETPYYYVGDGSRTAFVRVGMKVYKLEQLN